MLGFRQDKILYAKSRIIRTLSLFVFISLFLALLNTLNLSSHTFGLRERDLLPAPMLLESGLAEKSTATVSIVLFIPKENFNDRHLKAISTYYPWDEIKKSHSDWGATIMLVAEADAREEKQIGKIYLMYERYARNLGGYCYLEEFVEETIDGTAYFALNDIAPMQWVKSGSDWSWAGYGEGIIPPVVAGDETVNIQILTREGKGKGDNGKTILAMPALLFDI